MTIEMRKDIALDLIQTRIRDLDKKIELILIKWEMSSIDDMIEAAKTGKIIEAEEDAIDLENLKDKRNEIASLLG